MEDGHKVPEEINIEDIKLKEAEMTAALEKTIEQFESYKNEYDKIVALCDAFESQCERLNARCSVFEQLAHKSKALVEKDDLVALKRLYVSVSL